MVRKIMIVDDDKEFLEELKESLQMNDYEVVAVDNPRLALEIAINTKPDLVLLDLKMPQESGFQVACEIMYYSGLKNTSIIAMTGHFQQRYESLRDGYGFKGFLKKPFDYFDLLCKIETSDN
ncbi:MAG: response regulator [Candidatus Omnitrophica bacterium]|nr:response regulator [Candidatus Omnitrophota bacterium]